MSAQDKGAYAGSKLDQANNQLKDTAFSKSYRDIGKDVGRRLDGAARELNERTGDVNGKKLDQHLYELYDSTASLATHTYDYAWSWVPFTKQKVRQAKNDSKGTAKEGKENAKVAGNDAAEETKQTIFTLVNETRGIAGQILDTAHHYVAVADQKTKETESDAKSSDRAPVRASGELLGSVRSLAAAIIGRTRGVVTYGMEQGEDARYKVSSDYGQDAKDMANRGISRAKQFAGRASGTAQKYGQATQKKASEGVDQAEDAAQKELNKAQIGLQDAVPDVNTGTGSGQINNGRPGFQVSLQL